VDLVALRERMIAGEAVVAGVLSGTSADGIDVALTRCRVVGGRLRGLAPLAFAVEPFPAELGARVRAVLDGGPVTLRALALLHRDLGLAFGRALRAVAGRAGLEPDLAGSHGQTVWHHDGAEASGAATLQLGDGDWIAEAAGCAVASDFRQRDVAAGGEGAPLTPLVDSLLFQSLPRPAAILNLGGMGNLSLLPAAGGALVALDTGPAGSLLDGLARRLLGQPFDQGGARARAGRPHAELLAGLLEHPILRKPPPRSTGRDTFGEPWVEGVVARSRELGVLRAGRGAEDLLATGCAFVAESAALALRAHAHAGTTWLVACGGGVHNACLLDALAARVPYPLASAADFGVDPDAREALAFALLGACCALELPLSEPGATGAARGRVLGKLSPAPADGAR
jgi:anhydro-N-acetylmuramic acid kinase